MKNLKKAERVVIALTMLCLFFTAGYFTGRASSVRVVSFERLGAPAAPASDSPVTPAVKSAASETDTTAPAEAASTEAFSAGTSDTLQATPDTASADGAMSEKPDNSEKININTASTATLDQLPGVGPVLAKSIVDYREQIGGFKSPEQIMDVDGIGEKKFAAMKDMITTG